MQKEEKNRKRSLIVNFRMSPEERKGLDERIYLSGLKKQDYMIRSVLHQRIVVVGNQRMFEKFVAELEKIRTELKRINENSEMKVDMLIPLRTICEILEGLGYGPSNFNMKEE